MGCGRPRTADELKPDTPLFFVVIVVIILPVRFGVFGGLANQVMKKKSILLAGYGPLDGSYFGLNLLTEKYILKRVHFETRNRAIRFIRNNLLLLVRHADYLFMEYLYEAPLLMISALKMCRLSNRRIVAVSHTALKAPRNIFLRFIYRMVYSSIDTIMFFSPKNLEESVTSRMVAPQKARLLGWGRNLDYIDSHFVVSDNSFFISTG